MHCDLSSKIKPNKNGTTYEMMISDRAAIQLAIILCIIIISDSFVTVNATTRQVFGKYSANILGGNNTVFQQIPHTKIKTYENAL